MSRTRAALIWATIATVIAVPLALAAASPLLAWRDPAYIIAGFAGIVAMITILFQPLLIVGLVPSLTASGGRYIHRLTGIFLVVAVITHVAGLWITSPPDVIDALLFASPTPFSLWGVIAMWAVIAAALLAILRHRLQVQWRTWRVAHKALALVTVAGTVVHVLLIEGTMEPVSKTVLCTLLIAAMTMALSDVSGRKWRRKHR